MPHYKKKFNMYELGYKSVKHRIYKRNKRFALIKKGAVLRASTSTNHRLLITLPATVKYLLLKDSARGFVALHIYDKNYSFKININLNYVLSIKFYNDTNSLQVCYNRDFPFFKMGRAFILRFLHIFYTLFYGRLHVYGRLYRIYKRNIYRDLQYRFGHTHFISVYVDGLYLKYVRKKQIRFIGYD